MKIKVRATVTYEWEEDSDNWADHVIESEDELVAAAQEYAKKDWSYILNCDAVAVSKIEVVK